MSLTPNCSKSFNSPSKHQRCETFFIKRDYFLRRLGYKDLSVTNMTPNTRILPSHEDCSYDLIKKIDK